MTPRVLRRELMAIDAVSPPRVDGYRTLSAQKIFALRYRLKMRRVDAFYHPAKVVKIQPNGNWADKSLIRQAMPQPWVPARSVSLGITSCAEEALLPDPAWRQVAAILNENARSNVFLMVMLPAIPAIPRGCRARRVASPWGKLLGWRP
jgi:hypothetical protein